jgi:hypothetical protein
MNDLISRSALIERHCEGCSADVRESCKTDPVCATLMWVVEEPAVDAVSRGVLEQIKWERDVAMEQLEEHGIPFGGKAPDVVPVVRCKDCKYHNAPACPMRLSFNWTDDNDFCSYGERRNGDG